MIKTKNIAHATLYLKAPGTVTAAVAKDVTIVPFDGFISNIVAACASGGTGATNSILDVNYNGTNSTIFGAATKVTLASTTGVASYSALSSTPFGVTAGAILTLDADSVSTTLSNVCVAVTVTKTPPADCTNLADLNSIF